MSKIFYVIVFCVLLCGTVWFSFSANAGSWTDKEGNRRSWIATNPPHSTDQPRPLLLVLHGGGGTAKKLKKHFSFDNYARRDGWMVVYPNGLNDHWHDGRTNSSVKLFKSTPPDDIAFLTAIVSKLVATGQVNAEQVFIVGVSNGGMMTQRALCEASDVFKGGAALIANLPQSLVATSAACAPTARPVLLINGDADPLMPWLGGGVGFRQNRGLVLSSEQTFSHWRALNGCIEARQSRAIPDRDRQDGSTAKIYTSPNCGSGNAVTFIHIVNGGHTIPGISRKKNSWRAKRRAKLLGSTNMDIDARAQIWSFFAQTSHSIQN